MGSYEDGMCDRMGGSMGWEIGSDELGDGIRWKKGRDGR